MPAFYTSIPRRMRDLRQVEEPAPEPAAPPDPQRREELQAVLDEAHETGILEEPADAAEAADQGVTAARIEAVDGEQVLVETVAPKARKRRKKAER